MSLLTWGERLGRPACPYLIRWSLNLGPLGSLRLHHWMRSDDKRAPHDHPSWFATFVLKGRYTDIGYELGSDVRPHNVRAGEEQVTRESLRPGSFRVRPSHHVHIVDVEPDGCWTLLYFPPKQRDWGFWEKRPDGTRKFRKANKWFATNNHHPCDQP